MHPWNLWDSWGIFPWNKGGMGKRREGVWRGIKVGQTSDCLHHCQYPGFFITALMISSIHSFLYSKSSPSPLSWIDPPIIFLLINLINDTLYFPVSHLYWENRNHLIPLSLNTSASPLVTWRRKYLINSIPCCKGYSITRRAASSLSWPWVDTGPPTVLDAPAWCPVLQWFLCL